MTGEPTPLRDDLPSEMEAAERAALDAFLAAQPPDVAIEIGTAGGASLAILARHARVVHSIDIDAAVGTRLAPLFPGAHFHCGPSHLILPALLARLAAEGTPPGFILVDGDHSTRGVRRDLEAILRYPVTARLDVLMHDSFHPACRRGIRGARWDEHPQVHAVELDWHPGTLHTRPDISGQMWGGFAHALLLPAPRTGPLRITSAEDERFEQTVRDSVHARPGRGLRGLLRRLTGK